MVDLEEGVEILVDVQVVFFLKHLLRKVGNLGQTPDPRGLLWCSLTALLLLVKLD